MGQPVVHFEIMGKDGREAPELLLRAVRVGDRREQPDELRHVPRDDNLASDGTGIGGGIGQAPEGYDGHVTFYAGVDDVEAALAKAESLGGTRMMGPETVMEDVEIGLFQDPEGNTVGVVDSRVLTVAASRMGAP